MSPSAVGSVSATSFGSTYRTPARPSGEPWRVTPLQPGVFPHNFPPIVRRVTTVASSSWRNGVCRRRSIRSKARIAARVTNIRNVGSPHRRRRLGVESRCVAPFSSFSENEVLPDGSRPPVWFAVDQNRRWLFYGPLDALDLSSEGQGRETTIDLYVVLTTAPNAEVKAIHPKAIPVILTTLAQVETGPAAPAKDALTPQRPLPDGSLRIVARGDRTGDPPGAAGGPTCEAACHDR
jgi:putative SOS response-associated peptidase YedK